MDATDTLNKLNKLAKWRNVFAGWQLGTRSKADPESQAVRHHREMSIIQRAELSALTTLLIDKGLFTKEEFTEALRVEAEHLDKAYEGLFPGVSTTLEGVNYKLPEAAATMKGWRP